MADDGGGELCQLGRLGCGSIACLPVDRQIRLSVGLEYEINEARTVGGNFTWIDLGANNLDFEANANQGRVTGFYDPANMYVLGIYGAYRF